MDVIALRVAGVLNAVATMGTAGVEAKLLLATKQANPNLHPHPYPHPHPKPNPTPKPTPHPHPKPHPHPNPHPNPNPHPYPHPHPNPHPHPEPSLNQAKAPRVLLNLDGDAAGEQVVTNPRHTQ